MIGRERRAALFCILTASAVLALAAAYPNSAERAAAPPGSPVALTFNHDIAPILFARCTMCHHPGGSGPFSLMTYEDVRQRARLVAAATARRYMPPWPPEPGYAKFIGERRLTNAQINAIQRWVQQGLIEGRPSDLPHAPHYNQGWQLGTPDLVLRAERAFTLPAGGIDVFRNFILPVPVATPRYVKAVEILPGNKNVVHHANLLIDRSGSSRRLEGRDGQPGFPGMDVEMESSTFEPDTHFLFWKPGSPPFADAEMAWPVEPGTDLVLNMHLRPSGKPEPIQPEIGLYFSGRPPTKFPMLLQLENDGALDIPAGTKDFTVRDEFELPLDVQVLGVYPHAHYLGKDIQAFAKLPGGARKWLIRIRDWDLNWQAVYEYAEPVFLPKGSTISMAYSYDNSADNVRNPNRPPKRVTGGNNSSDEMAHLWLQVLPPRPAGRMVLQEALMRHRLHKYPRDFVAHFNLGGVLLARGNAGEAMAHFEQAVLARPTDARAQNNLGAAFLSQGRWEEAMARFREALRLEPGYANAHYNLGNALLAGNKPEEAAAHLREVLRLNPRDPGAHNDLGSALAMLGSLDEARAQFEAALQLNPENADAHYNLANVLAQRNEIEAARSHLEWAARLKPGDADIENELGAVLARQGNIAGAIAHFQRALQINPGHRGAQENLRQAQRVP